MNVLILRTVILFWGSKYSSILYFFCRRKCNQLGTKVSHISTYAISSRFHKRREKPKTNLRKTSIFTQNYLQFSKKSILFIGVIPKKNKKNNRRYMKFSGIILLSFSIHHFDYFWIIYKHKKNPIFIRFFNTIKKI